MCDTPCPTRTPLVIVQLLSGIALDNTKWLLLIAIDHIFNVFNSQCQVLSKALNLFDLLCVSLHGSFYFINPSIQRGQSYINLFFTHLLINLFL